MVCSPLWTSGREGREGDDRPGTTHRQGGGRSALSKATNGTSIRHSLSIVLLRTAAQHRTWNAITWPSPAASKGKPCPRRSKRHSSRPTSDVEPCRNRRSRKRTGIRQSAFPLLERSRTQDRSVSLGLLLPQVHLTNGSSHFDCLLSTIDMSLRPRSPCHSLREGEQLGERLLPQLVRLLYRQDSDLVLAPGPTFGLLARGEEVNAVAEVAPDLFDGAHVSPLPESARPE